MKIYHEIDNIELLKRMKTPNEEIMLFHLEAKVNSAIIQWNRIIEDIKELETADGLSRYELSLKLHSDIHSYFVYCDNVRKAIRTWDKTNKSLTGLFKVLEPGFTPFKIARDHLEHMDERIKPETSNRKAPIKIENYGCLLINCEINGVKIDYGYDFGKQIMDLSERGLKFICWSYEQVIMALFIGVRLSV